jgi:hypothetical protein
MPHGPIPLVFTHSNQKKVLHRFAIQGSTVGPNRTEPTLKIPNQFGSVRFGWVRFGSPANKHVLASAISHRIMISATLPRCGMTSNTWLTLWSHPSNRIWSQILKTHSYAMRAARERSFLMSYGCCCDRWYETIEGRRQHILLLVRHTTNQSKTCVRTFEIEEAATAAQAAPKAVKPPAKKDNDDDDDDK